MSEEPGEPGQPKTRITIPVVCAHCDQVTRLELTDEQAERLARGLQATARGMHPIELEGVRGEG